MDSQSADAKFAYVSPPATIIFNKNDYISRLADDLVRNASAYFNEVDKAILERACSVLPDLLEGFALKLGHKALTEDHLDVMRFILKNRSDITSHFTNLCLNKDKYDADTRARKSNDMPLTEIMSMWEKHQDKEPLEPIVSALREDDEQHSPYCEPSAVNVLQGVHEEKDKTLEDIMTLSLQQYCDIIFETEPYEWLISRLRREFLLTPTGPNLMNDIKQKILLCLPQSLNLHQKRLSSTYKAMFIVDWNPLHFVKTQQYEDKSYQADMAITLTGWSYKDTQALTCAQYLSQTWPGSGEHVMRVVLDTIRKPDARCNCKLPDNTMITAWIDNQRFKVEVLGCGTSVAEIGEQISWIGAALRTPTVEERVSFCRPSIYYTGNDFANKRVGHGKKESYQKNRSLRNVDLHKPPLYSPYNNVFGEISSKSSPTTNHRKLLTIQSISIPRLNQPITTIDDHKPASNSPSDISGGISLEKEPITNHDELSPNSWLSRQRPFDLSRKFSPVKYHIKHKATESSPVIPFLEFEIKYREDKVEELEHFSNGECWRGLFKSPVVVLGYPIQRRSQKGKGLEIPLNIMAGLAQAQRIDIYSGKVFIKGFSSMLIPTMRDGDAIIWHLVYNRDGNRISYLDGGVPHAENISALDLEKSRHILGWCLEARFYAGAADANYSIQSSELPRPHNGCALTGITASLGRTIAGGPLFCIGQKDTPLHVSRGGYIERLRWISRKFVIFWDEADKRGWLVNGTSALLHLVRASMVHKKSDEFCEAFLFNADEVEEAPEDHTPNSSIPVLINRKNQALKIYPEGDDYINFRHEVDKFYNILEKLIDYQADIGGWRGEKLKDHPRKYLEGWDFQDLAVTYDPISPRVTILKAAGKGWVDFTRAINAVTLFGQGFGDLIQPADTKFKNLIQLTDPDLCSFWTTLPKSKYYLASAVSDLDKILAQNDTYITQSKILSDGIQLYHSNEPLESCQCFASTKMAHSDPVQVFLPSSFSKRFPVGKMRHTLDDYEAVVFGQNAGFNWFWGDTGDPEEMESPPSEDVETTPHDSGIGGSASSSDLTSEETFTFSSFSQKGKSLDISRSNSTLVETTEQKENNHKQRALTIEGYTVGIICALPKELRAVRALFDKSYDKFENLPQDTNQYSFGAIGQHNVVAACLPWNDYGTISGATITTNMKWSFPALRFCLLVGIGGGVPSRQNDIRLGDVIVGVPKGTHPGVIQYDLGKSSHSGKFERTGSLPKPPPVLMTALSSLESDPDPMATPLQLQRYIKVIQRGRKEYEHPERKSDKLFSAEYEHPPSQETCEECCGVEVKRILRSSDIPQVHYGLIASGDSVVKDAEFRDRLSSQENVLCFEMEAAGVVNVLPCLVIRGVCDYADSHKNDSWQEYAAATAASYAKHLLSFVSAENRPFRKRLASDGSASGDKRTRY